MKKYLFDLISKDVVTTSGQMIGKVHDFVFDTDRGQIVSVLVEPVREISVREFQKDAEGFYSVSLRNITSMDDFVLVDPSIR